MTRLDRLARPIASFAAVVATAAGLGVAAPASAEIITLFDVNFDDTPFFQVPATGSAGIPRTTLSHITFGAPTVQATYGGLTDIPLVFDGSSQVRLWPFMTPDAPWYDLTFDVQLDPGNLTAFELSLFAPDKRTLLFDTEINHLWMIHSDGSHDALGAFDYSDALEVRVVVDREFDALIIEIDDEEVFRGFNDSWNAINQVSFGTSWMTDSTLSAGIDNIRFRADLPTCAADTNDDRMVGLDDLLAVLSSWDAHCLGCDADVNDTGMVDLDDLLVVLAAWGPCDD